MEVCIQIHNDPTALARKVDNLLIARSGESFFPYVGGLSPGGIEMVDGGLWNAGGPDRSAASSGVEKRQDLVVNQGRREGQRLPDIFVL